MCAYWINENFPALHVHVQGSRKWFKALTRVEAFPTSLPKARFHEYLYTISNYNYMSSQFNTTRLSCLCLLCCIVYYFSLSLSSPIRLFALALPTAPHKWIQNREFFPVSLSLDKKRQNKMENYAQHTQNLSGSFICETAQTFSVRLSYHVFGRSAPDRTGKEGRIRREIQRITIRLVSK